MHISSKGEYGLRALFDLAQNYGAGPIQSEEIATRQGIPVNYLNQVLISLRKAGLINSLRGAQGGHLLARAPDQITLLEALTVLEGPFLPGDLFPESAATKPEDWSILATVWLNLRKTIEAHLEAITLEDLCQRKRDKRGNIMYHI